MSGREYPDRPLVGVGVAVLRGESVLLIQRGRAPGLGRWALPGGAQKLGERLEAAARREVLEETGVSIGVLHLAAVVDSVDYDAGGKIRFHYTIIDYAAAWRGGEPRPDGDARAARFVAVSGLGELGLAGETMRVIARAGVLLRDRND